MVVVTSPNVLAGLEIDELSTKLPVKSSLEISGPRESILKFSATFLTSHRLEHFRRGGK